MTSPEISRFGFRAAALSVLAAASLAAGGGDLENRIGEGIASAREAAGAGLLVRREVLDGVARLRAERLAALPEGKRLARSDGLERDLRAAGIRRYRRATEFVDVQRGYADPVASILARWQQYRAGWVEALEPEWSSIGLGTATAGDGTLVFVAVLVQEPGKLPDLRELEKRTLADVNAYRLSHGLAPLRPSDRLSAIARKHSEAMIRRQFFGHVSPDGKGPADRIRAAGLAWRRLAENVARNQGVEDPVEAAVRGWEESEGHRKNMLDPEVTETGVGIAVDDDRTFYFTQLFLRPLP